MSSGAAENHEPAVADTPEHRAALLNGPQKLAALIGLAGAVAFLILSGIYFGAGPSDPHGAGATPLRQVFLSFHTGFVFWTLIGVGSVFFLCVQYVTGGRWGILLRRPLEANLRTMFLVSVPAFVVVAIGMYMGEQSIFWWARPEARVEQPASEKKSEEKFNNVRPNLEVDEDNKKEEWLSLLVTKGHNWQPFGAIPRGIIYFIAFGVLALRMLKNAMTAEYNEDFVVAAAARKRQKAVASVGLFVFAITLTFMATDWIMSLDTTFSSSMFPVIVFDNSAVASYALGLLVLLYLKKKGEPRFQHLFPATEQIHLGSLLLAFTLAWTYFNFSQYMLIWIGNLPEEIPYYLKRTRGGWGWYAAIAVIFHFPIPFLLLLFRRVKSSPKVLHCIATMLLIVIACDVMWWIAPSLSHADAPKFYLLMDAAAWVAIGGIWMFVFFGQLKKHPLLPSREIYLLEAYHHGH
jgi:hypothetical protein